ncbi:glycosyltransferase [Pseudoalteromonas agarivorans]|uniref:Uncharacterized protein n=1 Tax=Pseudoalteromonas agarivorans DSM 14585 TaxID=1312369 RepID=A0ACA8DSV2_9GAMM|nr:glycosyltransferase [Pseudoalteromonas agarivorans]ATC81063.1 hypothetical protein PAGA_a0509 [Pseudoalteromonas agarivorans DSM 14585]
MSSILVLKDDENEGSNNSAKLLAGLIKDCDVVALANERKDSERFIYNENGVRKFNSTRLKKKGLLKQLFLFFKDIKNFHVFFKTKPCTTVILNNLLMFNILIAAIINKVKIYVFIRELHMPKLLVLIYVALSKSGKVCVLSNNAAINSKYPSLNAILVENFVDVEPVFHSKPITSKVIKVLAVGSIYDLKNQKLLISILIELNKVSDYNFSIHHFGTIICEKYKLELDKEIMLNGLQESIIFHGKIENSVLKSLYKNFDLYIQTSKSEGMSRALMDAINNGLFCIASDVGDTSRLISNDCGVLFTEKNYKEKLIGIDDFLLSKEKYTRNAYSNLEANFSKSIISKKLFSLGFEVNDE